MTGARWSEFRHIKVFVAALMVAAWVPGLSLAGGLVPTSLPAIDPAVAAQLVITEASAGQLPQMFALGGRFVGDINGDGADDVALPATTGSVIELFFGSTDLGGGPQQSRFSVGDTQLSLPDCRGSDGLLHPVALGDLDGDGIDDLGVSCFEASALGSVGAYLGAVAIYWGRPAPWPVGPLLPDQLLLASEPVGAAGSYTAGERPGRSVVGIGDVDGDGIDDLLVTGEQLAAPQEPIAWVLRGSPSRSNLTYLGAATHTFLGGPSLRCLEPLQASPLGDVDGGGRPDFALICPEQPLPIGVDANDTEIGFSVFLGESLASAGPTLSLDDRDFAVQMLYAQSPRGSLDAALGDLDAVAGAEFAVGTVQDDSVQAQVVQGHGEPFVDITLLAPYAPFRYDTNEENIASLQVVAAGAVVGGGVGLWLRIGDDEDARIGLLADVDPSSWLDFDAPPFRVVFTPPGGFEPSSPERLAVGGRGDFDGDGYDDLLIISGFEDGAGCNDDECHGAWLVLCGDLDGDGISACAGDCDDRDSSVSPILQEQCDEQDHDCDGFDGQQDADEDGFATCAGDCADGDPLVFPGAVELCGDGLDRDCDGLSADDDEDGDGSANCEDCQPWMPQVNPEAVEICDGLDTDCNGALPIDEQDVDQDGFRSCEALGVLSDCDDLNPFVRPLRFEDCDNGVDDNCNGSVDEQVDADGDQVSSCEGDCNDAEATVFPGASELCDGLDNNCNGLIDDARDLDADGSSACQGDCDDSNPAIRPGAVGVCIAATDSNCDGLSDFLDHDGDGFTACGGDCSDVDAGVSPRATDWCDRLDNDCDGIIDGPFDGDSDSWATCLGDCDDNESLRFPQTTEPDCSDGVDGDCDGRSDGGDSDCPALEEPPPPLPRPYGLACVDCQGSVAPGAGQAGPFLALFLLALLRRRRSARRSQDRWLLRMLPAIFLVLAILSPEAAHAARKQKALVVYLAPQPDIRHMVEAGKALPRIDAVDVLHSSELFDADIDDLVVVGASFDQLCVAGSAAPSLSGAADRALDQVISFDNLAAMRTIDQALDALACLTGPMPPGALSRLLYYRGVVDHNLGQGDRAKDSFARLLAIAPEFPADPNFPPAVNRVLDEVRVALSEQPLAKLMLFSSDREGLRVDGRRVDAAAATDGLELPSGEHVVQISRGATTQTLLITLHPGQDAVVLRADERQQALRSSRRDPAAQAFTRSVLGLAAAEEGVDLVVLLDLVDGTDSFEFRADLGWFSFEEEPLVQQPASRRARAPSSQPPRAVQDNRKDGPAPRAEPRTAGRRARGPRPTSAVRASDDRVRLRLAGGYLYVHPFSYVHIPLDATIHLIQGLCVDFGGEWSASSNAEGGLISLPAVSAGLSYRLAVNEGLQLRFGALGRLSVDRQQGAELRPLAGWALRVGGDILPPGQRLVLAFDVQAGMLGKPFYVGGTFGFGLRL